ncbi:MAG: hypothetical protein EPO06_11715 [Burkholderiaceae bacterium]|nr:MAG: hypothetical protein EPO06_11715 [Burkholderiaceae bacterium]
MTEKPAPTEGVSAALSDAHSDRFPADGEMYTSAVSLVQRRGYATSELLQRRLRVGFVTAHLLVEALEDRGVVGPRDPEGRRPLVVVPTDRPCTCDSSDGVGASAYDVHHPHCGEDPAASDVALAG